MRITMPAPAARRPDSIHAAPCKRCPSAHYPADPEAIDMKSWPIAEQHAHAFPCAWRPAKLCKGYCDSVGMTDADALKLARCEPITKP